MASFTYTGRKQDRQAVSGVMVANFVRTQRELGFGLSEIRLRIIEAPWWQRHCSPLG